MAAIKEVGLFEKNDINYQGPPNFLDYLSYIVREVEENFEENFDKSINDSLIEQA